EKQRSQPREPKQQVGNLIDELINEEIIKFTSLDNMDDPAGAQSPSPVGKDGGNAPLDPGSFIDPRGWGDDLGATDPKGRNGAPQRTRKESAAEGVPALED